MHRSVQLPPGGCPTHRTPSAAGRSAAWPRTPAGSARRCATSCGWRGVRLGAAGRWARAAGGRVLGFSGGLRAQRGAGAAWEAGAPRGRGGAARGRHRGRRANPADPSSRPGGRSAGRRGSRNASSLPPHRSREPGTRCRETPAATGCASMADPTRPWKERTGTGTRGDHTALVAALPRVSSALTNGR